MEENAKTEVQSQQEFSFWNLPIFTLLFVVLITAIVFYPVITSFQAGDPAAAGSATWRAIFFLIIGYLGGSHAAKNYATKINGNQSWAFIIPYTFSLVGFGCYWLYYLYKRDKPVSQNPRENEKSIFKTILMTIGAVVLIILILVILSYIVLGSGISTTQKSYDTSPPVTSNVASYSKSTGYIKSMEYSSFENKSLGYKINYPNTWTYQTGSSGPSTVFIGPDYTSFIKIGATDLSSEYSSSSLDDLTTIALDSWKKSTPSLNILSNNPTSISGNYARELVITYTETSGEKYKALLKITKKGIILYSVMLGTPETNFDSYFSIAQKILDTFTLETTMVCDGDRYCNGSCWARCGNHLIFQCTANGGQCVPDPNNCPSGTYSCLGTCYKGCNTSGVWSCTPQGPYCQY